MGWYTNDRWKDFQSMFPNQTRSVGAVIVWSIILLVDIVIAALVVMKLQLPVAGRNASGPVAAVLIIGGLFFVENFIYTRFREIFR